MSDQFLGEIRMFGGNFAPQGWFLCAGQLLSITQYTALFSLLGTTYGGDGVSTFQLPNLQGRIPVHQGNGLGLSPYVLGQLAGNESVTITSSTMPNHSHGGMLARSVDGTLGAPPAGGPTNTVLAGSAAHDKIYSTNAPNVTMPGMTSGLAGNSLPHENRQPYLAVNFIIAFEGFFPSRN